MPDFVNPVPEPPLPEYPDYDISKHWPEYEDEIPEGSIEVEEVPPSSAVGRLTTGFMSHVFIPLAVAVMTIWIIHYFPILAPDDVPINLPVAEAAIIPTHSGGELVSCPLPSE